jgi:hypothetical protein
LVVHYDRTTGQQLGVLSGHAGEVEAAAFSPNGWLLASGNREETSVPANAPNPCR